MWTASCVGSLFEGWTFSTLCHTDVKNVFCTVFCCCLKTFFVSFLVLFFGTLLSIFNAYFDCLNEIDTLNDNIK